MDSFPFDANTLEAISQGRHSDPFSVLGLHQIGGEWWVTAFDPGAEAMFVLPDTGAPIAGVGHAGVFAARLPGPMEYRLRWQGFGNQWQGHDPFRFAPVLGELDEYLLAEGQHARLWHVLGAQVMIHQGVAGTNFAVWAPNATRVSVVGNFNHWDGRRAPMRRRGVFWEIFLPDVGEGAVYRYEIITPEGALLKSDPVGFGSEHAPANASVVRDLRHAQWTDKDWMKNRGAAQNIAAPMSIYEVHLPSWRRAGDRMLSYLELAEQLVDYAVWMGFTHIEFLPISEYPFDGSWGYQPVGLFAPTIRHGTPNELRTLIDTAHSRGLGVLIDWVPGHFPTDSHGLGRFDGTALFEHFDPKEGFHQDWNTLIYNYGRVEVANFLVSNALFWLEEFHIDGLRVDAVASMLYRDYSRRDGEWIPNRDGGRENYEAIALLRRMNSETYGKVDGIITLAEESTAFPGVSRPVDHGGLGFGFKWNMGWMNDTLRYMEQDPIHRKYHHNLMTFGLHYAWSENFVLPISHDEVVHGKGSMLQKMGGSFANLRAYYGFMWAHPGKKLLFMGCEFAQSREWNYNISLDWHEADRPEHRGVQLLVRYLNHLYAKEPALHARDCAPDGFQWIEGGDAENSVFVWARMAPDASTIICATNMTPVTRRYRIGLPTSGDWAEILNTDAAAYGGDNQGNFGGIRAEAIPHQGQMFSAEVTLPGLSAIWFKQP